MQSPGYAPKCYPVQQQTTPSQTIPGQPSTDTGDMIDKYNQQMSDNNEIYCATMNVIDNIDGDDDYDCEVK
jgi:hypothetical protein